MTRIESHLSRRKLFKAAVFTSAATALRPAYAVNPDHPLLPVVRDLPLEIFNPFNSVETYWNHIQPIVFDAVLWNFVIGRLWTEYERSGTKIFGEWAMMHAFIQWRNYSDMESRIRIAKIGQKMSQKFAERYSNDVAPFFWNAMHLGMEGLARGPLNAVQMVPNFLANLEAAQEKDSTYFYAAGTLALAKMYIKLPPPPVSLGNDKRGWLMLEKCRKSQQGRFAQWDLTNAEILYLTGDKAQALSVLNNIQKANKPYDMGTAYVLDTSAADAIELARRIENNTYVRYWDPLLEVAKSGVKRG